MLNAENAQLRPNILGTTAEEEEKERRQMHQVLKDRSNRVRGARRWKHQDAQLKMQKKMQVQIENEIKGQHKQNIFLEFNWDEDELEQECEQEEEQIDNNQQMDNLVQLYKNRKPSKTVNNKGKTHQRSSFLLALSSDQDQHSEKQQQTNTKKFSNETIVQTPNMSQIQSDNIITDTFQSKRTANDFLFNLDECSSNPSQEQQEQQHLPKQSIVSLNALVSEHKQQYFMEPIPLGKVFQCVMKREKSEVTVRYHLYDSLTLRNFMTVVKGDDYLVISKYDTASARNLNNGKRKDRVVGRVSSNFFGTQFSCSVENVPFKGRMQEIPAPSKKERVMTIEYETNLFGLRGPRKMTAYAGQGTFSSPLNQVYQKEKKISKKTVFRYKNKIPNWCDQTGSYVLNFYGRATVPSIKNFIMVGEDEDQQAPPRVLFGKFGRQLFNLDIRYPFSILQALALAISSFDKKLACQ